MSSRLMLWGALAVSTAVPACKPRVEGQSSVKATSAGNGPALDLVSTCRDSGSKHFLDSEGNALTYDKRPGPKSQNGWEDWNQGVATLDQEQPLTPFWRLSVPFHADDDVPFCLIGRSALAPRELAAALGCIPDDPCKGEPKVAETLVFSGNGDIAPLRTDSLALAEGAMLRCDGAQLLNAKGIRLGEEIPGRLGGPEACLRLAQDLSVSDFVCGFNGQGFTPFDIAQGLATGGPEQPESLQLCADLLRTARDKRVCALAGRGYRVYDLEERGAAGAAATTADGTFNSLDECSAFVADQAERGQAKAGANLLGGTLDAMDLDHASISDMYNARFYPGATTGDTPYRSCTGPDGFVFFNKCKVDTVYSWGPMVKISDLERQIGAGTWNQSRPIKRFDTNKPSPIFTTHSPVASHGYGEAAIRIRLKEGIEYVRGGMSDGCDILSDPSQQVVERYADRSNWNFVELIICAPGPIHSWSYFSKQQFDEIANATNLIYPSLEAISSDLKGVKGNPQYFKVSGLYGFVGKGIDDGIITNFREHMFKARLAMMARSARAGQKRVYVNSDIRSTTQAQEHFASRVTFPHQLTGAEEGAGGAAAAEAAIRPNPVAQGVSCETVAGKTFSGGGRKVVLSGNCAEYTKAGTYYGAARNVATSMQWTIDSSVRPSRIQVEILEGPIIGDVFYYAVTGTQKICFAGQTNYTGPTSSCMSY